MKKNVLVFGSISGLIIAATMSISGALCYNNPNFQGSMWVGYGSMLLAFSLIFVAIKNYRDKYNGGVISFGKAFKIGFYIVLITSTVYVLVWLIEFYNFYPDFMTKYVAHVLRDAKAHGATDAELKQQTASMATYVNMYKNPLGVIILTYMEVLPVGLVIALIAALILKRKNASPQLATS
ncbi:DUF4199 domain-containing protein [Mucilaginibacter sp. cycad4]|uniref:DUF4199 domain-containing protein n=1 Tax=Mucilaginibacter sp. cycad4 TaxID=3342096 RepID=UPI002AABB7FB|nr:DUF4199 domain-containing protein [Mucilaginibacter gossypii]WPU99544.1 DUF4199 domain-containing protein [Mucilaginibacter gossypii]